MYINDIVIAGSNNTGFIALENFLQSCSQAKDLGMLKYFLGIEVMRCKKMYLSVSKEVYLWSFENNKEVRY